MSGGCGAWKRSGSPGGSDAGAALSGARRALSRAANGSEQWRHMVRQRYPVTDQMVQQRAAASGYNSLRSGIPTGDSRPDDPVSIVNRRVDDFFGLFAGG